MKCQWVQVSWDPDRTTTALPLIIICLFGWNGVGRGLPSIFFPETTDIYEKKNMPRAVYCIHALSLFLYRQGKAPAMLDLFGKAEFSDAAVQAMSLELQRYGFPLPQFGKIGGILANQLPVDEAQHHAAIIAINQVRAS